jgi:pimeloyl-ACP methyl ester carboxylesterase
LAFVPAAVVGHSLGALIALELLLRHPELVRRASLLDPGPLDSAIPDRQHKMAMPEGVRAALATGGPEAGFEALLRNLNIWDAMDSAARQRAHANAEVFFNHETPLLQTYRPDEALILANRVPVQVAAGDETPPVFREMAEWLASKLNVPAELVPGGHASCVERPREASEVIRPFLQRLTEDRR